MEVNDEGFISDFCCLDMEAYSRKPSKCISFDLTYREYELADIVPKATIFTLDKSGLAVDQGAWKKPAAAGQQPIPISFCPWCGIPIVLSTSS